MGDTASAVFKTPVLNIGIRNLNRESSKNVISIKNGIDNIREGIEKITSPEFLEICSSVKNIYGEGTASGKIIDIIEKLEINFKLFNKKFISLL